MWANRYKYKGCIEAHSDWVNSLIIYNSIFLVSCSSDKTAKIWNTTNNSCITTFKGHTEGVYDLFSLQNYLVTCSADFQLRVLLSSDSKCLLID